MALQDVKDKTQDLTLAQSSVWNIVLHAKPGSGYLWISVIPLFHYCHHLASRHGPKGSLRGFFSLTRVQCLERTYFWRERISLFQINQLAKIHIANTLNDLLKPV